MDIIMDDTPVNKKTNVPISFSIEEVLGFKGGGKAAFLHYAIDSYLAYSATEFVFTKMCEKSTKNMNIPNLDGNVVEFILNVFDPLFLEEAQRNDVSTYLCEKYKLFLPPLASGKYRRTLIHMAKVKSSYSKVLKKQITEVSKMLGTSDAESEKTLDELVLKQERFPIVYYFLSKGVLRNKTLRYLKNKLALEKFAFDIFCRELVRDDIPIKSGIGTRFTKIADKINLDAVVAKEAWTNISSKLTALDQKLS